MGGGGGGGGGKPPPSGGGGGGGGELQGQNEGAPLVLEATFRRPHDAKELETKKYDLEKSWIV